jgi:hypothetical protein
VQLPETTTTTATATVAPPTTTQRSETSVTVTSAPAETATTPVTSTIVELTSPIATATTATVAPPRPKPVVETPPTTTTREEPAPTVEDDEPEVTRAVMYVAGGDSRRNARAMQVLRRELRGVTRVSLRGSGGAQMPLFRAMRQHLPDLEFDGDADIIIRYNGSGRQLRTAVGTVSKGDRVIFRYDSLYGSSPEAFASVIAEAFSE